MAQKTKTVDLKIRTAAEAWAALKIPGISDLVRSQLFSLIAASEDAKDYAWRIIEKDLLAGLSNRASLLRKFCATLLKVRHVRYMYYACQNRSSEEIKPRLLRAILSRPSAARFIFRGCGEGLPMAQRESLVKVGTGIREGRAREAVEILQYSRALIPQLQDYLLQVIIGDSSDHQMAYQVLCQPQIYLDGELTSENRAALVVACGRNRMRVIDLLSRFADDRFHAVVLSQDEIKLLIPRVLEIIGDSLGRLTGASDILKNKKVMTLFTDEQRQMLEAAVQKAA